MIKAILFDLDGTLVDSTEFIYQAYEYVLEKHGHEVTKREVMAPLIGRGLHAIYSKIAPTGDPDVLSQAHISFQSENFHLIRSFPNTLEVIKHLKLKSFKLGIITSRMKNTPQTLEAAGLDINLFDVIITADDVKKVKPDPEGILLALKRLKIKAKEAIFIGDGTHDIEMGKNAKVKTVGVTYGFGGEIVREAKPNFVIDDLREFLKVMVK